VPATSTVRGRFSGILATNFGDKWQRDPNRETPIQVVKNTLAPQGDLRRKLVETDRSLQSQIVKLDRSMAKMTEKEKRLFTKTTNAFQKHDTAQANAYANELTELRKAIKLVGGAKLALESVQGRLKTITDLGDLANTIAPVGSVVRSVGRTLQIVMPSANDSMSEISSNLDGLMQEMGSITGLSMNFEASSEESEKILAEASAIAETKMNSTLPSIPGIDLSESSSSPGESASG
jgi:division protein CdvB (Snf7/Vps24/ESCRT-III family)